MNEITAIFAGHIVVGTLFAIKEFSDKEKVIEDTAKFKADTSIPNKHKEIILKIFEHKLLVVAIYACVGYFNFYYVIKRLLKKRS